MDIQSKRIEIAFFTYSPDEMKSVRSILIENKIDYVICHHDIYNGDPYYSFAVTPEDVEKAKVLIKLAGYEYYLTERIKIYDSY